VIAAFAGQCHDRRKSRLDCEAAPDPPHPLIQL